PSKNAQYLLEQLDRKKPSHQAVFRALLQHTQFRQALTARFEARIPGLKPVAQLDEAAYFERIRAFAPPGALHDASGRIADMVSESCAAARVKHREAGNAGALLHLGFWCRDHADANLGEAEHRAGARAIASGCVDDAAAALKVDPEVVRGLF